MTVSELESRLLLGLTSSFLFENPPQSDGADCDGPTSRWEGVVGVAVDTNILKLFSLERIFAVNLAVSLASSGVRLIIPGQARIEFWNNFQTIAEQAAHKLRNEVDAFSSLAERLEGWSLASEKAWEVRRLTQDIADIVKQETDASHRADSMDMLRELSAEAVIPTASRTKFAHLAQQRMAAKMPPGFADATKSAGSAGDFLLWCDFLLGALTLEPEQGSKFFLVTDDKKKDWRTGGHPHPALVEEFFRITGCNLELLSSSELKQAAGQLKN